MTAALQQAIGRMTLAYSGLDLAILTFCAKLLSPDQRIGQMIFGPMDISRKMTQLRALYDLLPGIRCEDSPKALESLKAWDVAPVTVAQVQRLDDLLKRAKAAAEKRNTIVHALVWVPTDHDPSTSPPGFTILRVKGAELRAHPMSVSQLDELTTEFEAVTHELTQLMGEQLRFAEPCEPRLGRGTLWETTVKSALAWYQTTPKPPANNG